MLLVSRGWGGVPRGELRPGRGGGKQKVRREVSSSRFPRFPLAVRAVPPAPDLAFAASRLRDVIATARGRRSLRSFGSGPRSRPHVVPRRGAARLGRAAVSLPAASPRRERFAPARPRAPGGAASSSKLVSLVPRPNAASRGGGSRATCSRSLIGIPRRHRGGCGFSLNCASSCYRRSLL